jgi:hypothetical protein
VTHQHHDRFERVAHGTPRGVGVKRVVLRSASQRVIVLLLVVAAESFGLGAAEVLSESERAGYRIWLQSQMDGATIYSATHVCN